MFAQSDLTAQARAELFAKLATLERAGIPLLQALPMAAQASGLSLRGKLEHCTDLLKRGRPLPEAGKRSAAFLPWERRLLGVAVESGSLEHTFSRLAENYAARAKRSRALRTRFTLPVTVLVLATFVAPVPALFRGSIDALGYLNRTVVPLAVLYLGVKALLIRQRQARAVESGRLLAESLLAVPLAGGMIRRQQQRDFLASLGVLLTAGVTAIEALALASQSVTNPVLRARFAEASGAVEGGATVSAALQRCQALGDEQAYSLLSTAEEAGRLPEMLDYHVRQLDAWLDLRADYIGEWLPRVLYALGIGVVGGSMVL